MANWRSEPHGPSAGRGRRAGDGYVDGRTAGGGRGVARGREGARGRRGHAIPVGYPMVYGRGAHIPARLSCRIGYTQGRPTLPSPGYTTPAG